MTSPDTGKVAQKSINLSPSVHAKLWERQRLAQAELRKRQDYGTVTLSELIDRMLDATRPEMTQ